MQSADSVLFLLETIDPPSQLTKSKHVDSIKCKLLKVVEMFLCLDELKSFH
jgi:hypothetical protein